MAAGISLGAVGPARADGSQTFVYTSGLQTFVVPPDVYWVTIDAQGGHGGQFPNDHTAWGGPGGGTTATVPTTPGRTFRVYVGGFGWYEGGWGYSGGGQRGGASGAVTGYSGAGGGGDSAVIDNDTNVLILDAGGGGGAGGDLTESENDYGGPGGDGGYPPGNGFSTRDGQGGVGGGASGRQGENGENLHVGTGGAGGGGGGGFPNGGGGGQNGAGAGIVSGSGGAGGGAGSSYIVAGTLDPRYYTSQRGCGANYSGGCDGVVTFSWGTTPHSIDPTAGLGQRQVIGHRFSPLQAKVTNADGVPVGAVAVRFTLPADRASGTFPGGAIEATVHTDQDGIAVSPQLTANGSAGRWTAEATVADVATPARFPLLNERAPTATAATSSANPALSEEPVHVVARVAGGAGDASLRPAGTVRFSVDGDPVGEPVGLDGSGQATSPALTLPVGDHTVLAHYLGSPDFEASTATVVQRVVKAPTSTAVSSSLNPSGTGDDVAFSAHVTVHGAGTPTGTVQFQVDGSDLGGPVPVGAGGTATSPVTSALIDGAHDVSATYSGDADLQPSGGTLVQSVGEEATATVVSTSVDPAAYGEPLTIAATVERHQPGVDPEGRLSFQLDGAELCSTTLEADGASCAIAGPLSPGAHAIRVDYEAGPGYESSHGTLTQQVVATRTALELSAAPEPSMLGGAVVLRATLAAVTPGSGTPSGSVQFSVDGVPVGGPVAVAGGEAVSAPVSTLAFGPHVVEADYTDDAAPTRYATSHGATIHVVGPATTTTDLTSSANPASWDALVTFTARVQSGAGAGAPGTVQFAVDGTPVGEAVPLQHGAAVSPPVSGLAPGAHEVTAAYLGANGFDVSGDGLVQQVGPVPNGGGSGTDLLPVDPPPPRLEVRGTRVRVDGQGTLRLAVACVGTAGGRCTGDLRLATAQRVAGRLVGRRHRGRTVAPGVPIALRSLSLAAGTRRTVPVDLGRTGERIVSNMARLRAAARFTEVSGAGARTRRIVLRPARAPALAVVTRASPVGAGGAVAVRVRCRADRLGRCHGRLALRAAGRRLAHRAVALPGASGAVVRLRLGGWARTRIAGAGRLRVRAVATSTIRVGRSSQRQRPIVLRSP